VEDPELKEADLECDHIRTLSANHLSKVSHSLLIPVPPFLIVMQEPGRRVIVPNIVSHHSELER
jgi:hypothetical protein